MISRDLPSSVSLLHPIAAGLLIGVLGLVSLSGCQPAAEERESPSQIAGADAQDSSGHSATEQIAVTPSPAAQAQIDQFEPKFVTQMLSLQQRLQAEYESLKVADASDDLTASDGDGSATNDKHTDEISDNTALTDTTSPSSADNKPEPEENFSTEVGKRDLTVLKKVSLEPQPPEVLDEAQIKARYRSAFAALYSNQALSAQEVDTLINITTLLPELFEQPQLAQQLNDKSPALARLIVQQQIWRQIEAQQVIDMQRMKQDQQAEFESLMAKFNDTIKDYDEQIAKYEKMLKEFER
ncbi:hypothetical protein [Psychrobacter pygoscelis]|uniref:hypothetical protein n=1 Tax=Psychrobacter pygoscelis TaxID=2488563 RepID=UPI0010395008|nr:hypothetical protein [Psychrobacter pygoscelis]